MILLKIFLQIVFFKIVKTDKYDVCISALQNLKTEETTNIASIETLGRPGKRGPVGPQGPPGVRGQTGACECDLSEIQNELRTLKENIFANQQKIEELLRNPTICYVGAAYRGILPDSAFSANVVFDKRFPARAARLNFEGEESPTIYAGWIPPHEAKSGNLWVQIELGNAENITGIITQGGAKVNHGCVKCRTKTFKISYRSKSNEFQFVTENGQEKIYQGNISDDYGKVTNRFNPSIFAKYVRIHPITWESYPQLRIELLRC